MDKEKISETRQFQHVLNLYNEKLHTVAELNIPQNKEFMDTCLYLQLLSPIDANKIFQKKGYPSVDQLETHKKYLINGDSIINKIIVGYAPDELVITDAIQKYVKMKCPNLKRNSIVITIGQDTLYFIPKTLQTRHNKFLRPLKFGLIFTVNVLNISVKSEVIYFMITNNINENEDVDKILNMVKEGCRKYKSRIRFLVGDNSVPFVNNFRTIHSKTIINNYFGDRKQAKSVQKLINKLVIGIPNRYHLLKIMQHNLTNGSLVFDITDNLIENVNIIDIQDFIEVINPLLPFRNYDFALQILNPNHARIMLEDHYVHQGIFVLLCTPLLVGVGAQGQQQLIGTIKLTQFCLHVYIHLYYSYQTVTAKRVANIANKRGCDVEIIPAFSMELLENLIIYTAQLLQTIGEFDYSNFKAFSSFSTEACIEFKFDLITSVDAMYFGMNNKKRTRISQCVANLNQKITFSSQEEDNDEQLAVQVVQFLLYGDQSRKINSEQFISSKLLELLELYECSTFDPFQLTRSIKSINLRACDESDDSEQ
ncbi:Hypothetical_protein [Hexamita inflata]|uniref:Hypothetical_protein n=1 Tax=Hexamita inflata TaxID=28002 RepID=A0AA86U3U8_9EUKA|nr:Hypothetical protein HINF_LOCUS27269 [Hexamita inflata]